jgi:hypothetical protein
MNLNDYVKDDKKKGLVVKLNLDSVNLFQFFLDKCVLNVKNESFVYRENNCVQLR